MISGLDGLRFQHWHAEAGNDGVVVLSLDRAGESVNALAQAVLLELDAKLAAIDPGYAVYQAKEKFGGLRYYVGHSDAFHDTEKDGQSEAFHGLVREAEEASYKICEYCGAEGKSRNDRHWIKTLCDEHANVE